LIKKNKNGIFNVVSNEKLSKYNFGLLLAKQYKKNIENIVSSSCLANSFFARRNLDLSLSNKKFKRLYKKKILETLKMTK
jgi:dTDP-4-dehydrorhamnose reductase